jgi:hypothetical protein
MVVIMVMNMIVIMSIQCQSAAGTGPKQLSIFGCRGNGSRGACTTNMAVKAYDPIRRAHHDMQVMANHKHSAPCIAPYGLYLAVKRCRPRLIKTLGGLIQQENFWTLYQSSRKEHTLKLTTGQFGHLTR